MVATLMDAGSLVWLSIAPLAVALIVGKAIRRNTAGWPGPDDAYPRPPSPRGRAW